VCLLSRERGLCSAGKAHTIVADDGSWTTGVIAPACAVTIKIDKPGTYVYFAREFPWAKGQLVVR
jgi:hypothetical protein